jgi:hypothetical protein
MAESTGASPLGKNRTEPAMPHREMTTCCGFAAPDARSGF